MLRALFRMVGGCMTSMNYRRNHSRDLTGHTREYMPPIKAVTCFACEREVYRSEWSSSPCELPKDVRMFLGYPNPKKAWMCHACVSDYGTSIDLQIAHQLAGDKDYWAVIGPNIPSSQPEHGLGIGAGLGVGKAALLGWGVLHLR